MSIASFVYFLQRPFVWGASFFIKFAKGQYSIIATLIFSAILFALNTIFLDIVEAIMFVTAFSSQQIHVVKASVLCILVMYLHFGIWLSCADIYWFFRFVIRLFIVNNSFLLGVFFLTAIGMIHVGPNVVMNNPNVPYRIR